MRTKVQRRGRPESLPTRGLSRDPSTSVSEPSHDPSSRVPCRSEDLRVTTRADPEGRGDPVSVPGLVS